MSIVKWVTRNRRIGKQRANQILSLLSDGQWKTTAEIDESLPCCYQQTLTHLKRLVKEGKIHCSRKTKLTRYGQPSFIWKINHDIQHS